MTRTDTTGTTTLPRLDDVIAAHGARRVLIAALAALFHPPPASRQRQRRAVALSNHLREDIGLPPDGRPFTFTHLPPRF